MEKGIMSKSIRHAIAASAFALFGAIPAHAQGVSPQPPDRAGGSTEAAPHDELATETVFGSKVSHGGYGAPEGKLTAIMGDPALLAGVQGGWIVNHQFVLGIAGYGLASLHDAPDAMRVDGQPSTLQMGYGGVRLGYLLRPQSLVHVGFGLLIGGGGLVAVSQVPYTTIGSDGQVDSSYRRAHAESFFAIEPDVEVEMNLASFMRLAVSGSYRYTAAVDNPGLTNASLSAPAAGMALRFGGF
jgi:hypothetical protein